MKHKVRELKVWQNEENEFAISENNIWLPGLFNSFQAACFAFSLEDEVLNNLCKLINQTEPKRLIELEDMLHITTP